MGARGKEEHEARNTGVPQAWVWSLYTGKVPQSEHGRQQASDADPMLHEARVLHPLATALGLAIGVGIILGLVWLFAPGASSTPPGGTRSDQPLYKTTSPSSEADAAKETPAPPPPENRETFHAAPAVSTALSVEDKLHSFLEHGPGSEAAFDLDRVAFVADTATLTPTAHEELQRVARLLRAYPKAHIAIGAHADVQGGPAQIAKLSAERVRNVRSELMRLGVRRPSLIHGEKSAPHFTIAAACRDCVWIDVRKK
jgi:outer membrane protein OmpA-like peptidoglycan-associated protein